MKKTQFWKLLMVGLIFLIIPAQVQSCGRSEKAETSREEQERSVLAVQNEQKGKADSKTVSTPEEPAETIELAIYFSDDQAMYLMVERRILPKTETVAREAMEELIKGPKEAGRVKTMPSGTRLLGVKIESGIAYVDFSKEIVDNHPGGSAGEIMTVYSVVNTLTEFSTIKKVKFLVEGKGIDTLAGHMDLTEPLSRKEDIIKEN